MFGRKHSSSPAQQPTVLTHTAPPEYLVTCIDAVGILLAGGRYTLPQAVAAVVANLTPAQAIVVTDQYLQAARGHLATTLAGDDWAGF